MKAKLSINRLLPFLRWGKNMNRQTLQADVSAGLTGAAIVLPQGVAFAAIAGMPPEYGLYTSMVPAIIAALFGSSWHLVSGPTTAASIIMFSSLSVLAIPGSPDYIAMAITLAFMVGAIQLTMGLVKLGSLVNFISHSVIVGFTAGATAPSGSRCVEPNLPVEPVLAIQLPEKTLSVWQRSGRLHPLVTLVALITLLTGILVQKKSPKKPSMIIALLVGSLSGVLLNYLFGVEVTGIEMVGAMPQQLPPLSMPVFTFDMLRELAPLAVTMTLFALTEAVAIARSISIRSGQAINSNQEFIGQGLSNIFGSFFSSYVATGSFNRSGANYDAGAQTPLASILAGVLLVFVVLLIAPLTNYLPKAAVAGLLFLVAWKLINFAQIFKILKADRNEAAVLLVTLFGTLFINMEFAILAGVLLSLMVFLRKTSKPRMSPRVPDQTSIKRKFVYGQFLPECPQLKIIRLDNSLYFGSVAHVGELLRRYREHYAEQKHLLILTKAVGQVDVAGAELLAKEARERRKVGGNLYLYRFRDDVAKVFKRGGYEQEIGEENLFDSKEEAIAGIVPRLDRDICAHCVNRIFLECKSMPRADEGVNEDGQTNDKNGAIPAPSTL